VGFLLGAGMYCMGVLDYEREFGRVMIRVLGMWLFWVCLDFGIGIEMGEVSVFPWRYVLNWIGVGGHAECTYHRGLADVETWQLRS
jgi:hypothetical protein